MKRKIAVAVAVIALVGGGTYTAVAASGEPAPSSSLSASQAADAALKKSPGSIESIGLDDDAKGQWEVEIVGKNGEDQDVRVDAKGKASLFSDDDNDSDDNDGSRDSAEDRAERQALSSVKVNAEEAASAALKFRAGSVTEVDFDNGHWEVEVRAKDGREHEVRVDGTTGKASVSADDDGTDRDDRDDTNDRDDD
ncbi:PepSY domain-containing protein [Streptomyces sp. NPDC005963]|uniref:PepSY domain-containing protein n=1 Tax=Streptomyces sp. NPDC005963 TaxID=3156721 RepID=UPI003411ADFF